MTISTPRTRSPAPPPRSPRSSRGHEAGIRAPRRLAAPALRSFSEAGFTLTELMVAATLSLIVLAGVLSAFVMIGRSGYLASAYSELENETRRGLQVFGDDARKAADIRWHSAQHITLYLPSSTNATIPVNYAYDGDRTSRTFGCFYRQLGERGSEQPRLVLIRQVASDFTFQRFKLEVASGENTAASDLETKQLQVTLRATRAGATTVAANQSALSARYILRNKRVSN